MTYIRPDLELSSLRDPRSAFPSDLRRMKLRRQLHLGGNLPPSGIASVPGMRAAAAQRVLGWSTAMNEPNRCVIAEHCLPSRWHERGPGGGEGIRGVGKASGNCAGSTGRVTNFPKTCCPKNPEACGTIAHRTRCHGCPKCRDSHSFRVGAHGTGRDENMTLRSAREAHHQHVPASPGGAPGCGAILREFGRIAFALIAL